jgi:hypothetical protein
MHGTTGRRLTGILGTAVLVAVLAVAGCSAGSDNQASSGGDNSKAVQPLAGEVPPAAEGQPDQGYKQPGQAEAKPGVPAAKPGAEVPANLQVDQRSIIYTGSMTVRVTVVERAAAEAVAIVTGAGGFVGGDQRTSDTGDAEASLQLRVPADRFAAVVDALAKLGRQERREIKTQDVTEETLDLAARISTQQARVESGRRLLAQAKSLADLVMLESELAKREADLVALEARQRRLGDLTALSTITVRLIGPEAKVVEKQESPSGFLSGLRGGWKALLGTLRVVLTVLGALLPWLIALGVPALAVIWLARRYGQRAGRLPTPLTAAPAGHSTAPAARPSPPASAPPNDPAPPAPAPRAAPPAAGHSSTSTD